VLRNALARAALEAAEAHERFLARAARLGVVAPND
jgi:hypothetical protein